MLAGQSGASEAPEFDIAGKPDTGQVPFAKAAAASGLALRDIEGATFDQAFLHTAATTSDQQPCLGRELVASDQSFQANQAFASGRES